jgi:hypothetical protein
MGAAVTQEAIGAGGFSSQGPIGVRPVRMS